MAERDWPDKDYYEILGVSEFASADEIRVAYSQLAQAAPSPSLGEDPLSVIFQEVTEAHAVLSDEETRRRYDEVRRAVAEGTYTPPPLPPEPPEVPEVVGPAAPTPVGVKGAAVIVVVCACGLFLLLGYIFKASCISNFPRDAYRITCYNDLQPLYGERLFDHNDERVFPYIHAQAVDVDGNGSYDLGKGSDGAIEYPVLTGVFMYIAGRLSDDAGSFLQWSALLMAPFGLLAAYLLARMTAWRALLFALSPAVILYSFHNWDLLVVGATVAGFYQWWKGKPMWAAALFGIGGALKLYPIFFLAPLALELWVKEDKRGAVRSALVGVGTWLAVNLPFMLANFEGWSVTYTFHEQRGPNFDTIWCTMRDNCLSSPFWDPSKLNTITAVLTGAFFLGALWFGWLRAQKEGRYPFIPVCGALLAAFLLWNKVHSPQYALWLMPFFVLIRVNFLWWVGYAIGDILVYVGVFRWFYSFSVEQSFPALEVMETGIWVRAAFLIALFVVFLRSDAAHETTRNASPALRQWLSQPVRRAPAEQT